MSGHGLVGGLVDGDVPGGVDLVPTVVAIKHPWPDDAYVRTERRDGDVTAGAGTEIGYVADSYRLAVRELTATAGGEAQAIVPERALSEAGRAASADEKGNTEAFVDQSQASFRSGGLTLTSRLIEGQFPNYRQLLPEGGYENRLVVGRQLLLDAVRRVGLLARENTPVRMEFNALGVRLTSSSPDLGGAVEAVEAPYEGQEITAAFNPNYLADGLQAATGETIRLEVRDGLKPGVVKGEGDEFTYLVMPVRLPAPVG